jgi:putative ABC transport system permease protein
VIAHAPGLGIRLLIHNPGRLFAAFAGMAVAIVVMFVELGLLLGILDSQALMATLIRGDLVVLSSARTNLHKWDNIAQIRLHQVAALPDVERVVPIYQDTAGLLNQDDSVRRIVIMAFPPNDVPLAIGDPLEIEQAIKIPNVILFDRLSRPIFPKLEPGNDVELDGRRYRVGGFVSIGPDVVNDGTIVMSDGTWLAHSPNAQPIMGAIRLKPGVDPIEARARIAAAIPVDASVFTPDEIRQREINFTLRSAPIGILFGIGMLAGLVIGLITCYQILFNEITDRIEQYATLKAMGFSNGFLRQIILEQAILLSWGGFVVGIAITWLGYDYIAQETALAMHLSTFSVGLIFALATGMSIMAGMLALRRVRAADPAELY